MKYEVSSSAAFKFTIAVVLLFVVSNVWRPRPEAYTYPMHTGGTGTSTTIRKAFDFDKSNQTQVQVQVNQTHAGLSFNLNALHNESLHVQMTEQDSPFSELEMVDTHTQHDRLPPVLDIDTALNTTDTSNIFHESNQSLCTGESMARVFSVWNRSTVPYNWCHEYRSLSSGILFVKLNKCASSTGMGVSLRIADTLGRRLLLDKNNENHSCFARYNHGTASTDDRQYLFRRKEESVLWSIVRHPASRVLSDYFFYKASRRQHTATEDSILNHIQNPRFKTHYVDYLKLKTFHTRTEEIQHLIQNYDFIAVSERMDESLVVLSMILKVPLADVIVLSSKESGGYDDGRSRKGCVRLKRKWTTPNIDDYLAGDFRNDNFDLVLYQAVNASLDRTMDALGRDLVLAGVESYRQLVAKNERECMPHAIFPCPQIHPNQTYLSQGDCYFSDAGCGHKCSDRALRVESDDEWARLQRNVLAL